MKEPIRNASSPVIRNSPELMRLAALEAREIARATGTKLVISEDGVTKLVTAEELDARDLEQQTK